MVHHVGPCTVPCSVSYLQQLHAYDAFLYDGPELLQQIEAIDAKLFDQETEVGFLDAEAAEGFKASCNTFQDAGQVVQHSTSRSPDLRIIFLWRADSVSPLRLSRGCLLKLLSHHSIGACFLDLLLAFQTVGNVSERGNAFWSSLRPASSTHELCYQLRYQDENHRQHGEPWSERQIGVYHRFGVNMPSTMIMIGSRNGRAQKKIQDLVSGGHWRPKNPISQLAPHVAIVSACIGPWRRYLQQKAVECQDKLDVLLTTSVENRTVTFKALQGVRHLESQLSDSCSILQSTLRVVEQLQLCGRSLLMKEHKQTHGAQKSIDPLDVELIEDCQLRGLDVLHQKLRGLAAGVETLQRRIETPLGLLSDGLAERNQRTANSIAQSSRELTMKSLNDSYIVKVVTVITLIYLPVQGVATFFGMNLTMLPSDTNRLRFAKNWWLFLATATPLTVLTLMGLGLAMFFENRKRDRKKMEQAHLVQG